MHVKRGMPCQDYSFNGVLKNGSSLLVVADGVGNSKHSEIASKMAVETIVDVIKSNLDVDPVEILKEAYRSANDAIINHAKENEDSIDHYHTTLTVAIYDGDTITYGHSGDGGIIAIQDTGEYVPITKPQNGEDGMSVIPLWKGESSWEFGTTDDTYSSVIVVTDGLLDIMMPGLLKTTDNPVYVSMMGYFADNNVLLINNDNVDSITETRLEFINGPDFQKDVTDDRTIVVAINSDKFPEILNDDYYAEPDWDKLYLELRKKVYPHLYANKEEIVMEEEKEPVGEESAINENDEADR